VVRKRCRKERKKKKRGKGKSSIKSRGGFDVGTWAKQFPSRASPLNRKKGKRLLKARAEGKIYGEEKWGGRQ